MSEPIVRTPTLAEREEIKATLAEYWGMECDEDPIVDVDFLSIAVIENYCTCGPGWAGNIYYLQFTGTPEFVMQMLKVPGRPMYVNFDITFNKKGHPVVGNYSPTSTLSM